MRLELKRWNLDVRLQLRGSLQRTLKRAVDFEFAIGAVLRVRDKARKKSADGYLASVERDVSGIALGEFDGAFRPD